MNKICNIDLTAINDELILMLETCLNDEEFQNQLIEKIKEYNSDRDLIKLWFLNPFTPFLSTKISSDFFSESRWDYIISNLDNEDHKFNISFNVENKSTTLDHLINDSIDDFNYLTKYFGFDYVARHTFINVLSSLIYDKVLINSQDPNQKRFNVTNNGINTQIRRLWVQYLEYINSYVSRYNAHITDDIIEDIINGRNLDNILDKIDQTVGNFFSKTYFSENDILSIGTQSEDKIATLALFAYVALMNFDSLLKDIFGESILFPINTFNKIYTHKEYRFVPIAQMATSWRDESKIVDDSEEIGKLTRFIISTIPLYESSDDVEWHPSTTKKMTYKRLCNAFIKIYDVINDPEKRKEFKNITLRPFKLQFELQLNIINDRIPLDINLYDAICQMHNNMSLYTPIVLFLLQQTNYFSTLFEEDRQSLMSALFGIFDLTNNDSLKKLHLNSEVNYSSNDNNIISGVDANSSLDYYLYVLLMLSSLGKQTLGTYMLKTDDDGNSTILHTTLNSKDNDYRYQSYVSSLNSRNHASYNFFTEDITERFGIKLLRIVTKHDNKETLTIRLQKDNYILEINKDLYVFLKDNLEINQLAKLLINVFADFFNAIFPDDVSENSQFRQEFDNNRSLAQLLTAITYRLAVNEYVYSTKKTRTKVKNDAKKFIPDVTLRKQNNQIEVIPPTLTSVLRRAQETHDIISGISGDLMVSDNDGNKISLIKLSLASCKEHELWFDAKSNANNPTSHFILYEVFSGSEFIRDFKDYSGNVLKMTDANPQELFTSNILYDFLQSAINYNKVYIVGPIISDKPNILRITIDLNAKIDIVENGEILSLTLKDLLLQNNENLPPQYKRTTFTEHFTKLLRQEFGQFYIKQYKFVENEYNKLQEQFNTEVSNLLSYFGLDEFPFAIQYEKCLSNGFFENFESLNRFISELYEQLNNIKYSTNDLNIINLINRIAFNKKGLLKHLIHESIAKSDQEIHFRDGIMGHFEGSNWRSNHLLVDGLNRYTDIKIWDGTTFNKDYLKKYFNGLKPNTVDEYLSRIITDLLKLNTPIFLPKKTNSGDQLITKLAYDPNFVTNGLMFIAKLTYKGETINIASGDDYRRSQFNKDISDLIKFGIWKFGDNSPFVYNNLEFDINELLEFIAFGLDDNSFYNDLLKLYVVRQINDWFYNLTQLQKDELVNIILSKDSNFYVPENDNFNKNKDIINFIIQYYINNGEVIGNDEIEKEDSSIINDNTLFSIKFNPFLIRYNAINMLFWEEYTTSIVGHYSNHPYTKTGEGTLEDFRAAAITALNKRNVSFTATKHQLLLNQLNGIGDHFYSMTIEDLENYVYNLIGDKIKVDKDGNITPMTWPSNDGASFITKAFSILINNSLHNERVGHDKKLFGHMLRDDSGTGYIDKTCAFELSNERLRQSPLWRLLNQQMYSFFSFGRDVDITRDYYGRKIDYNALNIYYCTFNGSNDDGTPLKQWYKVIDVIRTDDGKYRVKRIEVNENYTENADINVNSVDYDAPIEINNVYELWYKILGGEFSGHYEKEGLQTHLIYDNDDSSHENLVKLMNIVGYRNGYNSEADKYFKGEEKPETLHDVVQPLKRIVGEATTIGAIKQGAENVNSTDVYYDPLYNITVTRIKSNDYGPLLDAEHTVQDSYIAMMTQVMNAASARGYSVDLGSEIYRLLHEIASEVVSPIIDSLQIVNNLNNKSKNTNILNILKQEFANIIVDSLKNPAKTDSVILLSIGDKIRSYNFNENTKIDFVKANIPIDSPLVLNLIISKISVALQKSAVRLRPQGNANVLVPSDGFVQLYDGHLLSYYGTPELALNYLLNKLLERELDESNYIKHSGDILIGSTYKYLVDGLIQKVKLQHPGMYWWFVLQMLLGKFTNIILDITEPTDLCEANFYFLDIEGINKYLIWDLASIHKRWNIEVDIAKLTYQLKLTEDELLKNDIKNTIAILQLEKNDLILELQEQLNNLDPTSNKNQVEIVTFDELGNYNYKLITIDKESVSSKAFDVIVPKSFKDEFMLNYGDDLKLIADNPDFFFDKFILLYNSANEVSEYDIALLGSNYTLYLAYKGKKKFDNYKLKKDVKYIYDYGKCYRVQEGTNETMYEVPVTRNGKPDIRIFVDENGNEIIETKQISFFLNNNKYVYFRLSDTHTFNLQDDSLEILKDLTNLLEEIQKSHDKILKDFADTILVDNAESDLKLFFSQITRGLNKTSDGQSIQNRVKAFIKAFNDGISDITNDDNVLYQDLVNRAHKMHNSFLKSLEFIVSRTPALCMLSFMAMRAAAFNNSGFNAMMVSRWLLFLLGSDFDVDKANVLTHSFKNGEYILWSPLQDYSLTKEIRYASDTIPFPTGKELSIDTDAEYSLFYLINQYRVYPFLPKHIYLRHLGLLINYINYHGVNSLEYTQNDILSELEFNDIINSINLHQLYFKNNPNLDSKNARLNRISTLIYQISINPVNWILGWAPIDVVTDPVNEEADKSKDAKESKTYTGRSVVSIMKLLVLTMEGKKDVGIVANSLKVYEAIAHTVYEILNHGVIDDIKYILFNVDVANHKTHTFANAYINEERYQRLLSVLPNMQEVEQMDDSDENKQHQLELAQLKISLLEAIDSVDNKSDAYTFLSALLSLAADNAKKPVLSTINGNTKMIGLYTAGIILGYNITELVNVINSETGIILYNLMQSNAFYHKDGLSSLWQASQYIKRTPLEDSDLDVFSSFITRNGTSLLQKLGFTNTDNNGEVKLLSVQEIQDLIGNLQHSTVKGRLLLNLLSKFKTKLQEIQLEINSGLSIRENKKVEYNQPSKIEEARLLKEELKGTQEYKEYYKKIKAAQSDQEKQEILDNSPIFDAILSIDKYLLGESDMLYVDPIFVGRNRINIGDILKSLNYILSNLTFDTKNIDQLINLIDNFLTKEYDYLNLIDQIRNDRFNGEVNFWSLDKLIKVNSEMLVLSSYTLLNLGFKTKIFELIAWVSNLSKLIVDKMDPQKGLIPSRLRKDLRDEYKMFKDKTDDGYINVLTFIIDPEYRKMVIDFADKIKTAINPYKVITTTEHYLGYLESMVTLTHGSQSISAVYKALMQYSPLILNFFNIYSSKDSEKIIKNMQNFFMHLINVKFFEELIGSKLLFSFNGYSNISLETEIGRLLFKLLMDKDIFPYIILTYNNNDFVKLLIYATYDLGFDHKSIDAYKLIYSSIALTDFEESKNREAKRGLQELMRLPLTNESSITIGELIFIYNLIVYDGKISPNSFTGFFDTIISENEDIIIKLYNQYISEFGLNDRSLQLATNVDNGITYGDFTEDELQIAVAPIISRQEVLSRPKYPFAYVIDPDFKLPILLKKVKITNDSISRHEEYEDLEDIELYEENGRQERTFRKQITDNAYSSTGFKYVIYKPESPLQKRGLRLISSNQQESHIVILDTGLVLNINKETAMVLSNKPDLINTLYQNVAKDESGNIDIEDLIIRINALEDTERTCTI